MTLDLSKFLDYDTKNRHKSTQKGKQDFVKIKIFCTSKNNILREGKDSPEGKKIFASHISDKGFISRIYKHS
jgi:hypothetical protein